MHLLLMILLIHFTFLLMGGMIPCMTVSCCQILVCVYNMLPVVKLLELTVHGRNGIIMMHSLEVSFIFYGMNKVNGTYDS